MKTDFKYFLNEKQLSDFDEFERKIKNITVEIEVDTNKLIVNAKQVHL